MTKLDQILEYFSDLNLRIPNTTYYRSFKESENKVIQEEISSLFHDIDNPLPLYKLCDKMETGVIPEGLENIVNRYNNDKLTVYVMFINHVFGILSQYLPYNFAKIVIMSDMFLPYIDAIEEYVFLPLNGDSE